MPYFATHKLPLYKEGEALPGIDVVFPKNAPVSGYVVVGYDLVDDETKLYQYPVFAPVCGYATSYPRARPSMCYSRSSFDSFSTAGCYKVKTA